MPHLISLATIVGTGLIGGSFALALRKYTSDLHVSGWDRPEIVREALQRGAIHESFSEDLGPALRNADLIVIALPIGVTLDLLPEIARLAPPSALVTDTCSTKLRITQSAADLFSPPASSAFLGGHPMAGREVAGIANADPDLFRNAPYALVGEASRDREPFVSAFIKILEKLGARPLWLGAQQHDYAVGLTNRRGYGFLVERSQRAQIDDLNGTTCAVNDIGGSCACFQYHCAPADDGHTARSLSDMQAASFTDW